MKTLQEAYTVTEKNARLFEVTVSTEQFLEALLFISTQTEFDTLSQIACADWIEEEHFLLSYILTNQARSHNLMLKIAIVRDGSSLPSLCQLFPQAEVMERDLHEMYGIDFEGNKTLYDFVLEQWDDLPPLRREFDTLKFVHERFTFKGGREDNKDVKVEQKRKREEAKKKKALEAAKKEAAESQAAVEKPLETGTENRSSAAAKAKTEKVKAAQTNTEATETTQANTESKGSTQEEAHTSASKPNKEEAQDGQ